MLLQCPKCGKGGGNRLQRGGVLDHLLSCVYIYPYRCASCWRRFRALRWGTRYVRTQGNRRRHRRFQTHLPVVFSYGQTHGEGVVTNIAMGGCRLQTDVQLTEDTPLELKLQVPGSEVEIRVDGRVFLPVKVERTRNRSQEFNRERVRRPGKGSADKPGASAGVSDREERNNLSPLLKAITRRKNVFECALIAHVLVQRSCPERMKPAYKRDNADQFVLVPSELGVAIWNGAGGRKNFALAK